MQTTNAVVSTAPRTSARARSWFARATKHVGAFGLTAALGLGALGAVAQQCNPPSSQRSQVVNITNQRRADYGIRGVSADSRLMQAAQAHSEDQARRRTMTHTGSNGSNAGQRISNAGYRWSTWCENVAAGYGSASSVMSGWMGSSSHRSCLLNSSMTNIGVGLAYSSDGTPYWTLVMARPG